MGIAPPTATESTHRRRVPSRLVALMFACLALLAASCGTGDAESASDDRQAPSASASSDAPVSAGDEPAGTTDDAQPESEQPAAAQSGDAADDDAADGDRGSRATDDADGPSLPTPDPAATSSNDAASSDDDATAIDATGDEATDTSAGDQADAVTDDAEPTPEPVAVVTPTATPVPVGSNPDPILPQPVPTTGPVPSDDLAIPGPIADDALPPTISEGGALTCATTEEAIEYLDAGDLTRMQATLNTAGAQASTAIESNISSLSTTLADLGPDPEAAFEAIVAMLSACAVHGYEV